MILDIYIVLAIVAIICWLAFRRRKEPRRIRGEIRSADIATAIRQEQRGRF